MSEWLRGLELNGRPSPQVTRALGVGVHVQLQKRVKPKKLGGASARGARRDPVGALRPELCNSCVGCVGCQLRFRRLDDRKWAGLDV